uniref:HAT C-terminal dimerisation domain-containing protein n=1 Tax=Lactuca sativa TaxID=4236 RepID=A0A9R1W7A4_LACSA|nr:hypothetical protein LSAT_V11C300123950 [Lactuca sativa]
MDWLSSNGIVIDCELIGKRPMTDESGGSILATHWFSYNESRTDLAKRITKHDYPLRIGLQPLFRPICRNTARSDVMKLCGEEKARMMHFLESIQVTAHFIDDSWQLQSRLLRFIYVTCPHTAEKLTNVLMDNLMVDKLPFDSLILGRSLFHMRCVAHILNLIVRSGLDVFGHGIKKVRNSCSFWTTTPKRLDAFQKNAKFENVSCEKNLVVDCKKRWNSTYLMLSTTLKYKEVFNQLQQSEPQYKSKWDTSSFIEINDIFENMITKFDEYWKESHGVGYGDDIGSKIMQKMKFRNVMSQASNDDITSKPTSSRDAAPGSDMDSLDAFFSCTSSTSEVFVKNELERYLEEDTLPQIHEFDVLGLWKLNGVKYPTLCLIAKDILAIPISTVASKSFFSTSGRIVRPHRSRLLLSTIKAIICTQNGLWTGCVIHGDDVHSDEDDEGIEEDIQSSMNEVLKEINGY